MNHWVETLIGCACLIGIAFLLVWVLDGGRDDDPPMGPGGPH